MSWVQNMSIGRKLMVIIMAISALTLLLACFAIVVYDIIELRRGMVNDASTLANMVAENSTAALTFHDAQAAKEVLRSLHTQPHVTAACLYTAEGQPFATYDRSGEGRNFSPPPPRRESSESCLPGPDRSVFRPCRAPACRLTSSRTWPPMPARAHSEN